MLCVGDCEGYIECVNVTVSECLCLAVCVCVCVCALIGGCQCDCCILRVFFVRVDVRVGFFVGVCSGNLLLCALVVVVCCVCCMCCLGFRWVIKECGEFVLWCVVFCVGLCVCFVCLFCILVGCWCWFAMVLCVGWALPVFLLFDVL